MDNVIYTESMDDDPNGIYTCRKKRLNTYTSKIRRMTGGIKYFCLLMLLCSFKTNNARQAAIEMNWEQFAKVTFKDSWSEKYKIKSQKPVFDAAIKKFDGKQISIAGFLIPITTYGNEYVLSANPYSGCYFCGNAGIESVIDLKFEGNDIHFKTDRFSTIEGKLELSENSDNEFIYVLHNSKEVK